MFAGGLVRQWVKDGGSQSRAVELWMSNWYGTHSPGFSSWQTAVGLPSLHSHNPVGLPFIEHWLCWGAHYSHTAKKTQMKKTQAVKTVLWAPSCRSQKAGCLGRDQQARGHVDQTCFNPIAMTALFPPSPADNRSFNHLVQHGEAWGTGIYACDLPQLYCTAKPSGLHEGSSYTSTCFGAAPPLSTKVYGGYGSLSYS